jgi:excisionase family DNA binding protein
LDTDIGLWTPTQAANYLGISAGTLSVWRSTGRYKLAYIKIGSKVRYRKEDLQTFLRDRTRTHTAQGNES